MQAPVLPVYVLEIWVKTFVAHGSRIATSCVTFLPPFLMRERGTYFERLAVRRIHASCRACRANVLWHGQ